MHVRLVDPDTLPPDLRDAWERATDGGRRFIGTIGWVPEHATRLLEYYDRMRFENDLGNKLTELVRLAIAETTRCPVCLASRLPAAVEEGLDEQHIAHLTDPENGDFTPREAAAVRFAYRFGTDHLAIGGADVAELHEHFSDRELTQLVMLCAQFLGFGRMVEVLELVDPVCSLHPL